MKISYSAKSDVGLVRKGNEDCYGIDSNRGIFIVADGMGGHAAGEVASRIMVDSALDIIKEALDCNSSERGIFKSLDKSIQSGNNKILHEAENNASLKGMGTTAVISVICREKLYAAWVGDSRIYLYRKGSLAQLSRDHSYVQNLIDAGTITEDEAFLHPYKNVITRAAGTDHDLKVDMVKSELKPKDMVILCTDGVTSGITNSVLEGYITRDGSPEETADKLIQMANERGGRDNSTVIVIRVEE